MPVPTKANVSRPAAHGYDCLVEWSDDPADSLYLRLAVGPGRTMAFQTVEPQDPGPQTAENPEDMRSESGRLFSRSDFTGGEGLDRAHRRNGTDRDWSRFWDSRNVDVTPARQGEPSAVRLLHSASSLRAVGSPHPDRLPAVLVDGTLLTVCNRSDRVDVTSDPTAASPTWTQEDPMAGLVDADIMDLTVLGGRVFAAMTSTLGVKVRPVGGGTWGPWTADTLLYERVWGVKGRVLASTNTGLYETVEGGDSILLMSEPQGVAFIDVVDAGEAILAGATDGNIYIFSETDGELGLQGQVPFPGEEITALGFAAGQVFIGTSESTSAGGRIGRLWRGLMVGLRIRDAQVLRQWGDGTETRDRSPKRIVANRESVWTAVIEDGTETHLWRYHLSTAGLVRDLILSASGICQGIAAYDDRVFATVENDGLWREDTTYASEGYLISPLADLYTAVRKAWIGARLATGELPTDTSTALAYSTDPEAIEDAAADSWETVITATSGVPGDDTEHLIIDEESRWIAAKVTLSTADTIETPKMLSFTLRGLPFPTETDYQIPVNVSDRLELPHRQPKQVAGLGEQVRQSLVALIGKAATVTLLRPDEIVIGQIRGVSEPIEELPKRGSPSVYALLTVRGVRQ